MSCLYCGKKRGLALFKKDGFCSAEHRQLWEQRESSNLVQRLVDARTGGDSEPLQPSPQRPTGNAPPQISAGETRKQLEDGRATPPSDVGIVIARRSYVAPVRETPKPAPPEPKPADVAPPQSVEPQVPVVRKVTPVRAVHKPSESPNVSHEEVRKPAKPADVPAEFAAGESKAGRCLYCGKRRGLALFKRDDFCSAEHRQLWEERESANLVKRLMDAREGGEQAPLNLPKRPSADPNSPSAVLRELQASIGQHATDPSEEIVPPPPAVEPVAEASPVQEAVETSPVEPATEITPAEIADPVVAGFVLPSSIQPEHPAATKDRPIWTADAPLDAPNYAIFLPASRAIPTGFAGSQAGVPIHACDAGSIANAGKRLNATWPGRAPFDTALVVESREPGLWNSIETPIPVQVFTLDQATSAENAGRNRRHSGSILSRVHDVAISSRTPELVLAIGAVRPALSGLSDSHETVDVVPAGILPGRSFTLPIGSVAQGFIDAEFAKLPTQHLAAYSRVGVSVGLSQSFRPSILRRATGPQIVTGDYAQLPSSFIAPGASRFRAVPAVSGREVHIGIDRRIRPALPGSHFVSRPFQLRATVPHRPTVSTVALISFAIPARAGEHRLTIARFAVGALSRLVRTVSAAPAVAAVPELRSLAVSSRKAEHKLALARFAVSTSPKLALKPLSVSPAVTLKALQDIGRLRSTLTCSAFVALPTEKPADKPAAVEATRGADSQGAKNAWTASLRTIFRRPRVDSSASIAPKPGAGQAFHLSGGLSGLETPERVWAKSLLLPVSRRSDLTRHAATSSKLAISGLGAPRTETSENRPRPDLKRGVWFSAPLFIERRKHELQAILEVSDGNIDGVALNSKAVAPQPSSPSTRTLFSQFHPLSLAQRAIEPQLAIVSHEQEAVESGRQSDAQTPVVLSVKAASAYTPHIERAGQERRNAQFVPIDLEQQLEDASVGMTASVSRLRLPGLSGRGLEPTLVVATYEQYPQTLNVVSVRDADVHGIGSSRSANPAIDSVRQGLGNPGFLPFDIEQPLMQEQTQAALALRPAPKLMYIPLRDNGKHIYIAAAAETWCDPIELRESSPLALESVLPPSATNSNLASLCILGPTDTLSGTSFSFAFKHLQVAAATSPWHDASQWNVPKVRLHEPLISLRGPSSRSLVSSDSMPSRSDTPFQLAPFAYCEHRPGTVNQPRPELTTNSFPNDFARDTDMEMLEMVLATDGADFASTETVETSELAATPERSLPGLFVVALQERFYPASFAAQPSRPQWLKGTVTSTNTWASNPVHPPLHEVPDQSNFWSEALKQSGVRAFGPFRMGANAQPELQWAPCKTSTRG